MGQNLGAIEKYQGYRHQDDSFADSSLTFLIFSCLPQQENPKAWKVQLRILGQPGFQLLAWPWVSGENLDTINFGKHLFQPSQRFRLYFVMKPLLPLYLYLSFQVFSILKIKKKKNVRARNVAQ